MLEVDEMNGSLGTLSCHEGNANIPNSMQTCKMEMRIFLRMHQVRRTRTLKKATSCTSPRRPLAAKLLWRPRKRRAESAFLLSILMVASLTCLFMIDISRVEAQAVDWNHVAQVAWRYYQPGVGVDATSGLHYGTLDWHYITDWDTGNYLVAILDAQSLGLIPLDGTWGANYRLDKVLHYLETRQLRDGSYPGTQKDGLPYCVYHSNDGSPATDLSRLVTDVADTGRLLVALYLVKTGIPDLATRVDAILDRVTPTGATLRSVYNSAFIQGKTLSGVYEYYYALGFNQFGFDVSSSLTAWNNLKNGPQVNVYGQLLPRADITTEPFLNGLLEIPGLVDSTFKEYASRVLQAQAGRWQATGYLTGWSEGADVSPTYVYEWIVHTTGETSPVLWKLIPADVPVMYTKVAIGLHAIFGTDYTQRLVNAVLGKMESQYGFLEAIRESDGSIIGTPTWPIQDKTNSLILAAARYALNDPVAGSLYVATSPSIGVQATWNATNVQTTGFSIPHDSPFEVDDLTAPTTVTVSGTQYSFNHWEIDGAYSDSLGSSNTVPTIMVGGTQPNSRTAVAYYLPTSPVSSTWAEIFSAPANTVYFIGNTNPYDNQAMLGAWAKTTNQQQIGLWTRTDWVDQATGRPLVSGNLVPVAGPIANQIVKYYAARGLTPGFRFSADGYAQIVLGDRVLAQMPASQIGTGTDMFVVHVFRDPTDGRLVLVIWGIGAQGTLASGVWLVSNFSSFSSMSDGLYVYQWTDSNSDNFPQPGEITPLYQGN